jgi:DNA-directed RNA polymerase specialized sigma24 family protein
MSLTRLSKVLAEEMTQEGFVTVWKMLPRYRAERPTLPEEILVQATLHDRLQDSLTKLPNEDRIVLTL